MVLIHEKITALLDQRRLKKRDLARALGVSPQTATDICKGRSAITLPHLRNLVSFFEIRAEFWLDNDRLEPEEIDRLVHRQATDTLARSGLLDIAEPEKLLDRLRSHTQQHREAFVAAHPDLTTAERRFLGLSGAESLQQGSLQQGSLQQGSLQQGSLQQESLQPGSLQPESLQAGSPQPGKPANSVAPAIDVTPPAVTPPAVTPPATGSTTTGEATAP